MHMQHLATNSKFVFYRPLNGIIGSSISLVVVVGIGDVRSDVNNVILFNKLCYFDYEQREKSIK